MVRLIIICCMLHTPGPLTEINLDCSIVLIVGVHYRLLLLLLVTHSFRIFGNITIEVMRTRLVLRTQRRPRNMTSWSIHMEPSATSTTVTRPVEERLQAALKTHMFLTARHHWDVFMIQALDINIQTCLLTEVWNWCLVRENVCFNSPRLYTRFSRLIRHSA